MTPAQANICLEYKVKEFQKNVLKGDNLTFRTFFVHSPMQRKHAAKAANGAYGEQGKFSLLNWI